MTEHRTLHIVLSCFPILTPLLSLSAQTRPSAGSPPISLASLPTSPIIERGRDGQLLNFDIVVTNHTDSSLKLASIELTVRSSTGRVVLRRLIDDNGGESSSIRTVYRADAPAQNTVDVFNPFFSLPTELDVTTLHYEMQFVGSGHAVFTAGLDVHPIPYDTKTRLILPVRGVVLVRDGHDFYSHHRRESTNRAIAKQLGVTGNSERYAYDFTPTNNLGELFKYRGFRLEDWFGYGAPVYAPGAGVVVIAADSIVDNTFNADGKWVKNPSVSIAHPATLSGNYVVIDHKNGEFSYFDHLQRGSVAVNVGDRIAQGRQIGRIGMSGNAGIPHLHYSLQTQAGWQHAEGLPSYFNAFSRVFGARRVAVRRGQIDSGDIVESTASGYRSNAPR